MKILMTQRALVNWAGTEMLTIEVANELAKRGHDVAVYVPRAGLPASVMISSGVSVKSRLGELPWSPDVIHGHHQLQAMAAVAYFDDVPAIFYSHGILPWPEQVPIHGRIYRYVVMCAAMAPGLETTEGIARDRIVVLPNFVNTRRFSEVRRLPARPTQAVLYGGAGLGPRDLLALEQACAAQGMSLEKIGYAHGNPRDRPEAFLPNFDLVFAVGRCALEALACGCAVIPIVPEQAGSLLTMDNYEDYAFSNLSPRYYTSGRQIGETWLATELASYSPARAAELTSHVRSTRTLTGSVDRLEQLYRDAIAEHRRQPAEDKRAFAPYLEALSANVDIILDARNELELMRAEFAAKAGRIAQLERELAQAQQASPHARPDRGRPKPGLARTINALLRAVRRR